MPKFVRGSSDMQRGNCDCAYEIGPKGFPCINLAYMMIIDETLGFLSYSSLAIEEWII